MIGYLRLELMRGLRDPRYLVLALVAPVGFYLLFTNLFGAAQGAGANGLPAAVGAMVSMAMFGAMWAVLSATSPRIAQERGIGWLRQLRLLPVRAQSVLTARLIAAVVLAGPALVLVFITAVVNHGVALDAWRWVVLLALLWLGAVPIALLGIALGYATDADSAFTITYGLNLVLAALGGLWMPISVLPRPAILAGMLSAGRRSNSPTSWRWSPGRSCSRCWRSSSPGASRAVIERASGTQPLPDISS